MFVAKTTDRRGTLGVHWSEFCVYRLVSDNNLEFNADRRRVYEGETRKFILFPWPLLPRRDHHRKLRFLDASGVSTQTSSTRSHNLFLWVSRIMLSVSIRRKFPQFWRCLFSSLAPSLESTFSPKSWERTLKGKWFLGLPLPILPSLLRLSSTKSSTQRLDTFSTFSDSSTYWATGATSSGMLLWLLSAALSSGCSERHLTATKDSIFTGLRFCFHLWSCFASFAKPFEIPTLKFSSMVSSCPTASDHWLLWQGLLHVRLV